MNDMNDMHDMLLTPRPGKRAASQVASTTGASATEVAGLALHASRSSCCANSSKSQRKRQRKGASVGHNDCMQMLQCRFRICFKTQVTSITTLSPLESTLRLERHRWPKSGLVGLTFSDLAKLPMTIDVQKVHVLEAVVWQWEILRT